MSKALPKLISALIVLSLSLALLAGCGSSAASPANVKRELLKNSIELAGTVVELAGSDVYVEAVAPSNDELLGVIQTISRIDAENPQRALLLTIPVEKLEDILKREFGIRNMSDNAFASVKAKMLASVTSQINGTQGATLLAASSVASAGRAFRLDGFNDMGYVVLQYGDNECIFVLFIGSKDGAVLANAMYVYLNDDMAAAVHNDMITEYLSDIGIDGVTVQELN